MHIDAIGAFLVVVANGIFWTLIFRGKSFTPLARAYFGWAFFITLWSFGYGITLSGLLPYEPTLLWNKYCQAMATMIGPFFFKFSCDVADRFHKYKNFFKIYLYFGIINAVGLFFTPYYVKGLWSFGSYTYQPLGGPLYIIFTLFFMWCTLHSYIVVALQYRKATGLRKTHMKLFLIATGVAYFGGVTLFFQGFRLPVPTTGVYLILAYVLIIGYSIHRYKFMDIEVIIKRTLVFAGLFGMVMAVVGGVSIVSQNYLNRFFDIPYIFSTISSVALALIFYGPTKKFLVNITDKYLFQKNEDVQKVLQRLSQDVLAILEMQELGKKIIWTLAEALRLETAVILVKDETKKGYHVLGSYGIDPKNYFYSSDELFIQYLAEQRSMLNLEDAQNRTQLPTEVLRIFDDFKAVIALPLYYEKTLIGALFLGKKKSDQEFNAEEIRYFPVITASIALALRNALETKTKEAIQLQAAHQMKLAMMGTMVSGMGHQLDNPINIISGMLQLYQQYESNGLFEKLSREELVEFTRRILQGQSESIDRMKRITKTMRQYALKPREVKKNPVDLKEILDRALYFIEGPLQERNIEIEKNYASEMPPVYVDRVAMDEIFLNLITNAMHAIKENGKITVGIQKKGDQVEVSIKDSGHGVSKENAEKMFVPFFTTKDDSINPDQNAIKGTGLGLFLVKLLVESNEGGISFESEEGRGTCFFIKFTMANIETLGIT